MSYTIDWATSTYTPNPLSDLFSLVDRLKCIGRYTTGTTTSITFTSDPANYAHIVAYSKDPADTSAGNGVAFIKPGANKIIDMGTDLSTTRSVSVNGNNITVGGLATYANAIVFGVRMRGN